VAADVIDLARRHDEAFNSHDPEGRVAIESSEVEVVYPRGLELRGPEQVLEMVRAFWEAMPDGKDRCGESMGCGRGCLCRRHAQRNADGRF
jgi:SnoaL-like domain